MLKGAYPDRVTRAGADRHFGCGLIAPDVQVAALVLVLCALHLPAGAQQSASGTAPAAAPPATSAAATGSPVATGQAQPVAPTPGQSTSAPVATSTGVGQVTHLSGTLVGRADGQTQPRLLSSRSVVNPGEVIATQGETYARIKFNDGTEVVLRPNTQFKIEAYTYDEKEPGKDNILFGLIKGGLRSVSGLISRRNKEKISFSTPTATVGIRGTHFGMLLCSADCANIPTVTGNMPPDGLHVDVAAGQIIVTNPAGSQTFNPGQFGYVPTSTAPPAVVPPQAGVRVTMPAVIANNNSTGRTLGNAKAGEDQCRP